MCGIFGKYSYQEQILQPEPLIAATQMLKHRGPDGGAYWYEDKYFLGHRRLSIIDLSCGVQPMATMDGRYIITFNGEIYNYLEIKQTLMKQGYTFKTKTDTEVILNAYSAWGTEVPKYLVGMFAFAIIDRQEHSLYLARDRFGEKPIFISETSTCITFASELIALTCLPDIIKNLNFKAFAEYLCLNYVPGDQTLINEINRLPPGCWRLYKGERKYQEVYWCLRKTTTKEEIPITENINVLKSKIDQAISITLRSDVPVTLFLSGGIDSSIVAESAVRQGKLKHAYCIDFKNKSYSEFTNAQKVADKLGIELRRVLLDESALQDFFSLSKYGNDPLGDSSALAVWTLAREVAKDYKVTISGDGCDELFGGYLTYRATHLHSLLSTYMPKFILNILSWFSNSFYVSEKKVSSTYKLMRYLRALYLPPNCAHFTWNGAWMPTNVCKFFPYWQQHYGNKDDILLSICKRHQMPKRPTIQDCQLIDCMEYLPNDILVKVDRMTMAHGLESRSPCLNHDIAEFAFNLPQTQKMNPIGKSKIILRELANQIFGSNIAYAKKQGFSIPIHTWLRNSAKDLMETILSEANLQSLPFLNSQPILFAKKQHLLGKQQLGFELWGLMVFIIWYKTHMYNTSLITAKEPLRRIHVKRLH